MEINDSTTGGEATGGGGVIQVYPLTNYQFGSKDAPPFKNETISERVHRLQSRYDVYGLRTCVEAVILVEHSKNPHVLLLQVRNSAYKLPGGRLRPGESDIDGLKRKLANNLSAQSDASGRDWEVGECIGRWWRGDFETLLYPYLPPNRRRPKECVKLFFVKLPESRRFHVPKTHKLLAVPLFQLHDNQDIYGPVISGIPQLLSKFSINTMTDAPNNWVTRYSLGDRY